MAWSIAPYWWPLMIPLTPLLLPKMWAETRRFRQNTARAEALNREYITQAPELDLPELEYLELTVLAEEKAEDGFIGEPGVSYCFRSPTGTVLFDVGFGPERPTLAHNAEKLGLTLRAMDAVVISHLHPDHMGGHRASHRQRIALPQSWTVPNGLSCFLPDQAAADGFKTTATKSPQRLPGGMAVTGPLARSLFLMGLCREQAIIARIKDKGLVVFTGCGHPTIELILELASRIAPGPIYAVGGGLHFPITGSRFRKAGIQFQMILGTGLPPWKRITDSALTRTIASLNQAGPMRVLLSAHDTCDYALRRMQNELTARTEVLKAGAVYRL